MQMDRRITTTKLEDEGVAQSPVRPRASVWIDPLAQQNISASYSRKKQQSIPNPQTPIPARASAVQGSRPVKVRPRYGRSQRQPQTDDITRMQTLPPPTMWQYELQDYEAESSLRSLSLAYSEGVVERAIDEMDTIPPPRITEDIAELDTVPALDRDTPPAQKSTVAFVAPKETERTPIREIDRTSIRETEQKPIRETRRMPARETSLPYTGVGCQASRETKRTPTGGTSLPYTGVAFQPGSPSLMFGQSVQAQEAVSVSQGPAIDEIATLPPGASSGATQVSPIGNQRLDFLARVGVLPEVVESGVAKGLDEGNSWTTGAGKDSPLAKRITSRRQHKSANALNPLDRLRWWLLFPGRIEFLLWLSGTIVLVSVTCMLLFATLLSVGWPTAGLTSINDRGVQNPSGSGSTTIGKTSCTAGNAKGPQCHSTTAVSTSGLKLTLVDNTQLLPGTPIYVRGQGFTANNSVNFSYDNSQQCRPETISTDAQGAFSLYLMLRVDVKEGTHQIMAYDVGSKGSVTTSVTISPTPTGNAAPTTGVAGATPTAAAGAGGGGTFPTPVDQTPVPITPTVDIKPTTVPTQPAPTVGITPSPTVATAPTVGISPTVAPTLTATNGKQQNGTGSLFNNTLDAGHNGTSISLWVWIAVIGYALSMTMLGCAGLLYRRNRRLSSK